MAEKIDIFVDQMLMLFRQGVERGQLHSLPITLNVHGVVVTGSLCSRSEYDVEIEAYVERHSGQHAREFYAQLNEDIRKMEEKAAADDPEDLREIFGPFIHLKDARFMNVNGVTAPFPWRGKITSVDAFSIGSHPVIGSR